MASVSIPKFEFRINSDDLDRMQKICDQMTDMLKSKVCVWTETRGGVWGEDEIWETSCNQAFCMIEGTLKENSYNYCPNCGSLIKEIPYIEEAEE